ncbi:hypothetical protein RBH26_18070 [Natronolimnohabitans sp. A-GB9]|nr:hypothetical protein [Natronolimnohabitans sp. A-GB9]MDQ2052377.1 hypothetical protein [Natronolimnohabitans sp. A-GB9]
MTGLDRTIRLGVSGRTVLPVTLAVIVAVLGALLYLELVFLLLEYV